MEFLSGRVHALLLAAVLLFSAAGGGDPDPAAVEATRKAFEAHRAAAAAYSPDDPASRDASREALRALFEAAGSGTNIEAVHELLKDGTIDAETSARMAEVRNGMVDEVMRLMTLELGEVHAANFSPAVNLLNDIDQTFRPVAGNEERPAGPGGEALKAKFNAIFTKRFGISPERMDVVSHAAEASIPDWGQAHEVHRFVAALRQGSNMLASNPEAYFLEGAFRMQVERRSFASDQKLYSIYTLDPRLDGQVARTDTVLRHDGTIRELAYRNSPPEARKSYALGSTVGNFWFMNQHGGGVRYAAKYGLRSFSEGPGWLTVWDLDPDLEKHTPKEYEKIGSESERRAFFQEVYERHYNQSDISPEEAWRTLETARQARNLGDRYNQEAVFGARALELVHGDEGLYRLQRQSLLNAAEHEFRQSMTAMMMHNIEVALPERLSDWLDPVVDPRRLDVTPEDVFERTPKYLEEHAKAKKRLRTAALFESMHALRTLDPELRARVIDRAIVAMKRRSGLADDAPYPFERSLRSIERLAGAEEKPRLLMTDDERRLSGRVRFLDGKLEVQIDPEHAGDFRTPELERQVGTLTSELENALRGDGLIGRALPAGEPGLFDVRARWSFGVERAVQGLADHAATFASVEGLRAGHLALRRTLWESLGYRAQADFEGVHATVAEAIADMHFDLPAHVLDWGNANSVLDLIKAFRSARGDAARARELVGQALLQDLAGRLPYAGELMSIHAVLSGDAGGLKGAGILAAEFLYPGVGQVAVVYDVASKTWELVHEQAIEDWIQLEYQGRVPGDDGAPGPGRSRSPIWADTPGVLEPVRDFLLARRAELLAQREKATAEERIELDRLLAGSYPANPRLKQVRNAVFAYFDPPLSAALERSGRPQGEWDAIKLGSYGGTIRSNEPKDLLDPANLPPLLRAFFRPLVHDYLSGTGPYAGLEAHRRAHAHPLLKEIYFPDPGPAFDRAVEDLVDVLVVGYGRALLDPANRRLLVDREWDTGPKIGATAYLFGLPAAGFAGQSKRFPGAGEAPDLPGLLDVLGPGGEDAWRDRFFPFFDGKLNALLEQRLQRFGKPQRADWTAYKLGLHHADLRPVAAENAGTEHPLLRAFFTRYVTGFREQAASDDTGIGGLVIDDIDTSSVGASPTTDAPFDPARLEHNMEKELSDADKQLIVDGLVQNLIRDYKLGYFRELAERRRRRLEARTRTLYPAARSLQALGGAIWGAVDDDGERPLAAAVAAHTFVPTFLPDDATRAWIEETATEVGAFNEVTITITGAPEEPLSIGGSLNLHAEITAPSRKFERPYRVEWRASGGRTSEGDQPNQHMTTALLGNAEEGLTVPSLEIEAVVTDATGRSMGSSSVAIPLAELDGEEDSTSPAAPASAPTAANENAEGEESDPASIERVAYVVRIEGGGWSPHYAGGSYYFEGHNDQILWVKRGENPQALVEALAESLVGDPCKGGIPAFPGRDKRPLFWQPLPTVDGIAGPFFDSGKLAGFSFEDTWHEVRNDGPSLGELRKMFGCN